MRDVYIHTQPIQLYKLLKLESLVSSGGEAKMVISEGLVEVNGEIETRKRKQINAGDVIVFGEEAIKVNLDQTGKQS